MYGAANFSNLGPMLSAPVALVMSILFRYFSTFSCPKVGIEKLAFSVSFSLQNALSLSKLEGTTGYFILELTDTKNVLIQMKFLRDYQLSCH